MLLHKYYYSPNITNKSIFKDKLLAPEAYIQYLLVHAFNMQLFISLHCYDHMVGFNF